MRRNAMFGALGLGAICAGFGLSAQTAHAGISAPLLNMELWAGGALVWQTDAEGQSRGDGSFAFEGGASTANWVLDYNVIGDPDPFIIANTVVTNISAVTQTFQLFVTLPIFPTIPGQSVMGGSIQGGLTADAGGGVLSSALGMSIYQAMIDGFVIGSPATLLDDPISISAGAFGSNSFTPEAFGDMPFIPSAAGPPALVSIGIMLTFSLTAGDSASFTSIFVVEPVIPGPGAMALVAVAGVFSSRRRR